MTSSSVDLQVMNPKALNFLYEKLGEELVIHKRIQKPVFRLCLCITAYRTIWEICVDTAKKA